NTRWSFTSWTIAPAGNALTTSNAIAARRAELWAFVPTIKPLAAPLLLLTLFWKIDASLLASSMIVAACVVDAIARARQRANSAKQRTFIANSFKLGRGVSKALRQ